MSKIKSIRKFNPAKFTQEAISFLRTIIEEANRRKIILGLSGGVDSAVAAVLAVKSLGKENVIAVRLPAAASRSSSFEDAGLVAKFLGLGPSNLLSFSVASLVKSFQKTLGSNTQLSLGNAAARARMMILFDLASQHRGMVLGTENKTENRMGYFTRFGDAASDIELLTGLYKSEIWQLAKYLKLPQVIINKTPTADLWPDQTDEGEMGALYHEIDAVLRHYENFPRQAEKKISQATGVCLSKVGKILRRLRNVKFKQEVPYCFKSELI